MHMVEIGRAERGLRDLRVSTIATIAQGLNIPASELLRGVEGCRVFLAPGPLLESAYERCWVGCRRLRRARLDVVPRVAGLFVATGPEEQGRGRRQGSGDRTTRGDVPSRVDHRRQSQ
jgi:hypothetical protein